MLRNVLMLFFLFVTRLTLQYRLTTYMHQFWKPNTLLLWLYQICMLSMKWTVWTLILCILCISRIRWWQGMKGKSTCILLLVCYTACNVICAYIACVTLASISQNFWVTHMQNFQVTRMQVSSLNWAVLYATCSATKRWNRRS